MTTLDPRALEAAALLEVIAEDAQKRDDTTTWSMASVMAERLRAPSASPQPALAGEGLTDEQIIELAVTHSNYREGVDFEVISHARIVEFARHLLSLVASPPPSGAVEARKRLERAGGAMSNILYNLKQDPTQAEALRDRMSECQEEWDAALSTTPATAEGWRTMDSAPDLDRVIVAGWCPPTKRVAGYWWFDEDLVDQGRPMGHPDATLWHPFPRLPASPTATADGDDGDEEACVVCDVHLEAGDLVYWSTNDDGHMHAECATSYVDEDGNDTVTAPKPLVFRPDAAAPTATGGR